MKIAFLLCSPDISGGTNVIFEHASGLKQRGHSVTILTQSAIRPERYKWHDLASDLEWVDFQTAKQLSFDIVIATWWESPYFLHRFNSRHFVYFVQSIESKFFQPDDPKNLDYRDHSVGAARCLNSYFISIPMITEAFWIQEYLRINYNQHAYLVHNGIHKQMYDGVVAIEPRPEGKLRVLIEGPVDVFHKNVPKTIKLCQAAGVDEIWLLTSSAITEYSGVDKVFSQISFKDTPAIYSSCHVLVKLSYVEGMFGPPLEMFHCGGTALVYDVTGHDEYIRHNVNGIVVCRDDEEEVVRSLKHLKNNKGLMERLCNEASETANKWPDWAESVDNFNTALDDIGKSPVISREYLKNITETFCEHQSLQLEAREAARFRAREGQEDDGTDNFVQFYICQNGHVVDSSWQHYPCDERVIVKDGFNSLPADFQVRLDPSVRLGILYLHSITIMNQNGDVFAQYDPQNDFDKLYVTGTAKWILRGDEYWVIESYGCDPQIFLPKLNCIEGEKLNIEVQLMETGFSRYVNSVLDQQPATLSRKIKRAVTRLKPSLLRFFF